MLLLMRHAWTVWEQTPTIFHAAGGHVVLQHHHTAHNAGNATFRCTINFPQMVFVPSVLHLMLHVGPSLCPRSKTSIRSGC